jgi:hypothetical protein
MPFEPHNLTELWHQAALCCGESPDSKTGSLHSSAAELIVRQLQPQAACAPGGPGGWLDPKSRARAVKIEQKRIQKEVTRKMRAELVVGFDPFTWLSIGSIVFKVLQLIWNWWHADPVAPLLVQTWQRQLAAGIPNEME